MRTPFGQVGHIVIQAAVILAASLGLTVTLWLLADAEADKLADTRFGVAADEAATRILDRMQDYGQILRGGVAMMENIDSVSRDEWRNYVDRLDLERRYPGIQGIGIAPRVDPESLAAYEQSVHDDGFDIFRIAPVGRRQVYFPIHFLEPFSGRNLRAFGYDMFSEPVRRAAMRRAGLEGGPALTDKLVLVQETDTDVQPGVLLYLPYYRRGADLATPEARWAALAGFVYSPFRMTDLMTAMLAAHLDQLEVAVYDGEAHGENLLFGMPQEVRAGRLAERDLQLFGQVWHVEMRPTAAFAAELESDYPDLVLGTGIVISFLLMWAIQSMVAARLQSVALAESNRQLATARQAAEAANRAKARLFAAASHDMRQPAQSLVLLVTALAGQLVGHPAGRMVAHLEQALAALRMVLDGLLDISRLDAGVVVPQVRPVCLAALFADLAGAVSPAARQKQVDLRVVSCSAWVDSDPQLLCRILRNLLENAVRYTERNRVVLGCRRRHGALLIEVWDTGIGIPADQLERIFEEFHQVGNAERDRSKGLGLGLAIARRMADLLGHPLTVRSQVGRGSVFGLEVPCCAAPAAAETGCKAVGSARHRG